MLRLTRHVLLAALLCAPAGAAQDPSAPLYERGRALVATWHPTEYAGHEQNWDVLQDSDGILLVANESGLLEFDGERWSVVEGSAGLRMRGLARGPDGSVYAASTGGLGFLAIGPGGARRFEWLVGPELGDIEVDQLLAAGDDLLFAGNGRLLVWRNALPDPRAGTLLEVPLQTDYPTMRRLNILGLNAGVPLVHAFGFGLLAYEDGQVFALPPDSLQVRGLGTGLVDFGDGEAWITTLSEGLWLLRNDLAQPLPCETSDLIAQAGCMGATLLSDGRVALATAKSGLVLCDRSGNLLEVVDRDAGLIDSTCMGPPYEDSTHGCWVPLSFGLARYNGAHSIESFDYRDGLDGPVLSLLRVDGELWAGTFTGLFHLTPTASPSRRASFSALPGVPVSCFDLASRGNELLVASARGLERVVDGQFAQHVPLEDGATDVLVDRHGVAWAGTFNAGLFRIDYDAQGEAHGVHVPGSSPGVRWMVEDTQGRLWFETSVPTGATGIARLEDGERIVDVALPDDLPLPSYLRLFLWRGEVHAATNEGVLRWDEGAGRMALDRRFEDPYDPERRGIALGFVDASDRLWVTRSTIGELLLVAPQPDGSFLYLAPLRGSDVRLVQSVLSEGDGRLLWIGNSEGHIVRHELEATFEAGAADLAAPMLRSAAMLGGADLFALPERERELPWSDDTLRFEYAAPLAGLADVARYQTRLAGLEQGFGPWTLQSAREFAGLREGDYAFEVRARSSWGQPTEVARLPFRVLPPWYRTLWAYAGGLLLLAAGVVLYVRARLATHLAHVTRLRSEIAEREAAERRYRALVEDLDDWVLECDAALRLTYSSPRVRSLLGRAPQSVLGHTLFELMQAEQAADARSRLSGALAGSVAFQQVDLLLSHADGHEVEFEISGTPERSGTAALRWRLVARDVTSRRHAEEQRRVLEEQLRETRRLEAVGRLAGGISHDFNNLLTALLGNAYLLRDRLTDARAPLAEDIERCLGSIEHAGQRAADLTSKLLSFSRKQVTRPEVFAVNAALGRLEGILRRVIREDIELVFDPDPGDASIEMDPGQFDNAILNLVINARDALSAGGAIVVGARTLPVRDDAAPRVDVYVSDNGVGMDRATQERIFEPFFTTKGEGRGTGLGLASVHGIVQQAGGAIRVESSPGSGTTMHMTFDAVLRTNVRKARPRGEVRRGTGWVLVCEDEDSIRGFLEQILTASGYQVILTSTPDEALQAAASHGEPIDLLLTDVVLPGRNGRELAEELCRARPNLRVLFMSGYSDDVISHRGVMERGVEFIAKPFRAAELLERLGALR